MEGFQALEAPQYDLDDNIIRMGRFQTQISFLGCIGYILNSSGLTEVFETVYAGYTIQNMLSRKAVKRTMIEDLLTDISLNTIILDNMCSGIISDLHSVQCMISEAMD